MKTISSTSDLQVVTDRLISKFPHLRIGMQMTAPIMIFDKDASRFVIDGDTPVNGLVVMAQAFRVPLVNDEPDLNALDTFVFEDTVTICPYEAHREQDDCIVRLGLIRKAHSL